MKNLNGFMKLTAVAVLAGSTQAHAAFSLPAFNDAYAGQDGDFTTYSLPLLQYVLNGDAGLNSGDQFYVKSTPGELGTAGKYVVVGTFPPPRGTMAMSAL